ncbi:MAG TPA: glycosyltransferase family 87 protein [Intrasporangium sp.]|uniref:glycosyltransferase family 87 protein n=1 Tax=Intrasporangium sp. TaxID=1925024 RepID=UPI002D764ED8|nr:glycosyltransferase family 87 protein [Intrasporangium sp.]HET7398027.1 glycosyltransferase family 87 protein [Intrasporangium sp.]
MVGFAVALGVSLLGHAGTALPDYAARWTAGRLLLTGQTDDLYDPQVQAALQHKELGTDGLSWFVSPPFVAVLFAPLAALPYAVSSLAWTAISLGALLLSIRFLKPLAPAVIVAHWPPLVMLVLACYPALELLGDGQDTAVVALVVVAAIRLSAAGRDVAAGVLLGLATIKPHLAVLLPLVPLVQRRFRTLLSAALTAVGLLALSVGVVGVDGMREWVAVPTSTLYSTQVQQGQAWKAVNLGAWLTAVAPPSWGGWWTGLATAAGLLAVVPTTAALWRLRGERLAPWSLVLAATVVASPHFMVYDLVLATGLVVGLARRAWDAYTRVSLAVLFVLLWLMAPLHALAGTADWPVRALAAPWPALGFLLLWWRMVRLQGVAHR